jgi:hypothetical protein
MEHTQLNSRSALNAAPMLSSFDVVINYDGDNSA